MWGYLVPLLTQVTWDRTKQVPRWTFVHFCYYSAPERSWWAWGPESPMAGLTLDPIISSKENRSWCWGEIAETKEAGVRIAVGWKKNKTKKTVVPPFPRLRAPLCLFLSHTHWKVISTHSCQDSSILVPFLWTQITWQCSVGCCETLSRNVVTWCPV